MSRIGRKAMIVCAPWSQRATLSLRPPDWVGLYAAWRCQPEPKAELTSASAMYIRGCPGRSAWTTFAVSGAATGRSRGSARSGSRPALRTAIPRSEGTVRIDGWRRVVITNIGKQTFALADLDSAACDMARLSTHGWRMIATIDFADRHRSLAKLQHHSIVDL